MRAAHHGRWRTPQAVSHWSRIPEPGKQQQQQQQHPHHEYTNLHRREIVDRSSGAANMKADASRRSRKAMVFLCAPAYYMQSCGVHRQRPPCTSAAEQLTPSSRSRDKQPMNRYSTEHQGVSTKSKEQHCSQSSHLERFELWQACRHPLIITAMEVALLVAAAL